MNKINFKNGTLVKPGYVEIDGVKHNVIPPECTGDAPINANNLNLMQDNIDTGKIEKSTVYSGDVNNINDTCYYYCSNATNTPLGNGYLFTQRLSDDYIYQRFTNVILAGTYERVKSDGIWREWKKVSPVDITTGTEVVTNEIINGKNVYMKRIDCGSLPNANSKAVPHNIDNLDVIRDIKCEFAANNGTYIAFGSSCINPSNLSQIITYVDNVNINFHCGGDSSNFLGCVTLYYSKN